MQLQYNTVPAAPLKDYLELVARRPHIRSKQAWELARGDAIQVSDRHNEFRHLEIVDAYAPRDGRSAQWGDVRLECEDIFSGSAYAPQTSRLRLPPHETHPVCHVIYVALRVIRQLDRDMFLVQDVRTGGRYRITGVDYTSCQKFENTLYQQRRTGKTLYMMWASAFHKTAYLGNDWPEDTVMRFLGLDEVARSVRYGYGYDDSLRA